MLWGDDNDDDDGSDVLGLVEADAALEAQRTGTKTCADAPSSMCTYKWTRKNANDCALTESLTATTEFLRTFIAKPPTVREDQMDRDFFGSYVKGALTNTSHEDIVGAKDSINSMLSMFDFCKKHAVAIPVHSTASADVVVPPAALEVLEATPTVSSLWPSASPQFQGPYLSATCS